MAPRSSASARVVLTALLAVAVSLVAVAEPAPVSASCGTNWKSKQEPPETILVLRTATGEVEEVGLKRYVAVVMASGEWPTTLPKALLKAGALATKQYAWYHALEGNHRDGYHNASGRCYDVRDDSRDQVYRPESAEPTDDQKDARDELWGLSLRKNDDFLLTGYRQGTATRCEADADGWHLYTRSAKDCAMTQGLGGREILHAYYGPKLTEVWAPGTEPKDDEADAAEPPESPGPTGTADPDESSDPAPTAAAEDLSGLIEGVSTWFGGLFGDSDG